MKKISLIIFALLATSVFAEDSTICEKNDKKDKVTRCINSDTKTEGSLTFAPSYKNTYEINLLPLSSSCDGPTRVTGTPLPKRSYFKQTLDHDAQTAKEMIVHVYDVEVDENAKKKTTELKYFNNPFRLCLSGASEVSRSNYTRVGGVSTGLLVVPFKFRDGDIYSDSTIGQYISYKWEVIEVLATAGLSQISISEVGTSEVESKTGLTLAFGVNFEIAKNWDIAVLVGQDHLSGNDGDDWEFQDDAWVSFAIGFNFTR